MLDVSRHRSAIWFAVALIVAFGLYPPWHYVVIENGHPQLVPAGYGLLLQPPAPITRLREFPTVAETLAARRLADSGRFPARAAAVQLEYQAQIDYARVHDHVHRVIAAIARLRPVEVTRVEVKRKWIVPTRWLRRRINAKSFWPPRMLRMAYRIDADALPQGDLVVSAVINGNPKQGRAQGAGRFAFADGTELSVDQLLQDEILPVTFTCYPVGNARRLF